MLLPILYTNQRYDATKYIYDNTLIKTLDSVGIKDAWKLEDNFAQYKINISKKVGPMKKNGACNYIKRIDINL